MPVSKANLGLDSVNYKLIALFVPNTDNTTYWSHMQTIN